jgi:cytochrome P450
MANETVSTSAMHEVQRAMFKANLDGEEDLDPFEKFNRAQGAGSMRSPYPVFAELRKRGGVALIDPLEFAGADPDPNAPELPKIYSAVSYDAVAEVLRDGKRFSSRGYEMFMGPVMGHTILEMDEPEHGRVRGLLQQAFTRRNLERWENELVRPVVTKLVDAFAERGHADLVRELTFPFPVTVIAGMLGLPEEEHADFHRLAVELISVGLDPEAGMKASHDLKAMFQRAIERSRISPGEDLISVLTRAELEDGSTLDDELIVSFCRLLAPAGAETTYRSSSNLLLGLLSHTDQLDAVRNDRKLIPQAIDEGLRWECPLTGIQRTSTEDTEVTGVAIPAGQMIHVNLGSANHDETRWDDPEEFDILFDRFPKLRLDPDAEDVHITGMAFRSPLELPVRFD